MLIAIDFDDTLTADPKLWSKFIKLAQDSGHNIICVTARFENEMNNQFINIYMNAHNIDLEVYYTGLTSKTKYMTKKGLKVDVWIDDNPETCALGH